VTFTVDLDYHTEQRIVRQSMKTGQTLEKTIADAVRDFFWLVDKLNEQQRRALLEQSARPSGRT
jgi:hypothetical protein